MHYLTETINPWIEKKRGVHEPHYLTIDLPPST
jgi:hypothetical protein